MVVFVGCRFAAHRCRNLHVHRCRICAESWWGMVLVWDLLVGRFPVRVMPHDRFHKIPHAVMRMASWSSPKRWSMTWLITIIDRCNGMAGPHKAICFHSGLKYAFALDSSCEVRYCPIRVDKRQGILPHLSNGSLMNGWFVSQWMDLLQKSLQRFYLSVFLNIGYFIGSIMKNGLNASLFMVRNFRLWFYVSRFRFEQKTSRQWLFYNSLNRAHESV